MGLYINGRPVNPLISILVTALVLAGVIGLALLLLPLIGGVLLFILICGLAVAAYGVYYRWRYGDPLKAMQQAAEQELKRRAQAQQTGGAMPEQNTPLRKDEVRTGVRRTTTVEDVTIVEEVRRRGPQQ